MGWLILLGALVFPAVFMLWQPRTRLRPGQLRVRVAGSVVAVWMLIMLWNVREAASRGEGNDYRVEKRTTTAETSESWQVDANADMSLIVLFGWVPGLIYCGLLVFARKGMERPAVEVFDAPPRPR